MIDDNDIARRMQETIADIAYIAGQQGHYSGDSRADIHAYILWANEFEQDRWLDESGNESYNGQDYMTAVQVFAEGKRREAGNCKGAL